MKKQHQDWLSPPPPIPPPLPPKQEQLLTLAQRRIEDAMTLFEEQRGDRGVLYWQDALSIVESIRGTFHNDTAKMYLGLGGTLQSQGKYYKAKQNFFSALRIYQMIGNGFDGRYLYSKGTLQAWIGLGKVYTSLEKWHDAMKAFQSAARIDFYNSLILNDPVQVLETPTSSLPDIDKKKKVTDWIASQRNNFNSVMHLKELIANIETNHSNNRNKVWSHFPNLPGNIESYLDFLQITTQHEVQGDLLYNNGQFDAAQREYQIAWDMLRQQVHSTINSGIHMDQIWLVRKRVLAELGMNLRSVESEWAQKLQKNTWIPLNQLVPLNFHHECPMFGLLCDALVDADSILREAVSDRQHRQKAYHQLEEASTLAQLYHSIYRSYRLQSEECDTVTTESKCSINTVNPMKHSLNDLRNNLFVVDGRLSENINAKNVWQALQRLSIFLEAHESVMTKPQHNLYSLGVCQGPNVLPTPTTTNDGLVAFLWLLAILLQFIVLPLFLLRKFHAPSKYSTTNTIIGDDANLVPSIDNKTTNEEQSMARNSSTSSRIPTLVPEESHKAKRILQMIDSIDTKLNLMSDNNENVDRMANKVSASIFLQKTRRTIVDYYYHIDETDVDSDRNDISIQFIAQMVIMRLQDLGFGHLLVSSELACGDDNLSPPT